MPLATVEAKRSCCCKTAAIDIINKQTKIAYIKDIISLRHRKKLHIIAIDQKSVKTEQFASLL